MSEDKKRDEGEGKRAKEERRSGTDRRRFLMQAAAAGAAAYAAPKVVSAQVEPGVSPLSPKERAQIWKSAFEELIGVADRIESVAVGYLAESMGFDQRHLTALGDLRNAAGELHATAEVAFAALFNVDEVPPRVEGDEGFIELGRPTDAITKALELSNELLEELEEVVPQIPTGGTTERMAGALRDAADAVGRFADAADRFAPGAGAFARVVEVPLRVAEAVLRILTLPCD